MKGIRLTIVTVLLAALTSFAQALSLDLSYAYIYAEQWDKAIQTYNFSRPDLTEKQPLLVHGTSASMSYFFPSQKIVKQGIGLQYYFTQSSAENPDFLNSLRLHTLQPSYILQFAYSKTQPNLTSDVILSTTLTGLFRRLNGAPYVLDEVRIHALGIGGSIQFKTAYRFEVNPQHALAPFVQFGYSPYLFSPKTESLINQTQGLSSESATQLFSLQLGCAWQFHLAEKHD